MTEKRYGVLCYLPGQEKRGVVLITRRSRKEWIFPKGRRIPGKSGPESALREAYEEGGLKGRIFERNKITVMTGYGRRRVQLTLYRMRVDKMLNRWPESNERKRIVVSSSKAEKLLRCRGMRRGLKHLTRT